MLGYLRKKIDKLNSGLPSDNHRKRQLRALMIGIMGACMIRLAAGWFIKEEKSQQPILTINEEGNHDLEKDVQEKLIASLKLNEKKQEETIKDLQELIIEHGKALEVIVQHQQDVEDKIVSMMMEQQQLAANQQPQESISSSDRSYFAEERKLKVVTNQAESAKNTSNYIPAGSFVNATILGGLDASTSINAQSEPRPVLLLVDSFATLPNFAKFNIRACHILASGYGDLSSERAFLRTERLSCTLANERIIDTAIEGYITDETGKDGVRGPVVSREGDMLTQAFFASSLKAIGSIAQSSGELQGTNENKNWKDSIYSGVSQGLGHGIKEGTGRLESYLIKRLEAISPVVQVGAGRKVNIVFTKGFFINE